MKNTLLIILLSGLALKLLAQRAFGHKDEHGDPEDEIQCFQEIRRMRCGNPEDHKAFITCVDFKIEELSERCQKFHKGEVERMKNHGH
jgi:hypothetical protein